MKEEIQVRSDKGKREYYFKKTKSKSWENLPKTKPMIEKFLRKGKRKTMIYSERTKITYLSNLHDFFKIIHKEFDEVTFEDVEDYVCVLRDKKKNGERIVSEVTIGNRLATIQRFYNWLKERKIVEENPVKISIDDSVENSIFSKKLREIPTREEMKRIMEVSQHPRHTVCLSLLYNLGMRVSELCDLTLSDLDLEKWEITIRGKGGRCRTVEIPQPCIKSLENWLRYRKAMVVRTDYLIISKFGLRLRTDYIRKMLREACDRAGVDKHITPHSLRRMFFTNGIEDGIPPKVLQFIAGQKTSFMIDRYVQFTQMKFSFRNSWKGLDSTIY